MLLSGVRHLCAPFLSCLLLRVLRSTLRAVGLLPQAHSDKWYPSVETWTLREGHLRKLWRTSGHQLLERSALANEVNGERFYLPQGKSALK